MEILLFCVVIIFFTSLVGPLEVEIFPAPLEVLANEDALLKCKYKEPESDLSHVAVRWTFTSQTAKKDVYIFNGGKHQPIRNGAKMFDNALQKGNASLYLPNVQRYEEGTYTCVVFVTPHKEEKSSVMQVSVQPKVSMSVQEISTANGTEHFLQCDVKEFYPKPIKVSWFKLSDGKMEYVSTSQSTEDIVTNSDGTFSVSTKIKTEPTWDEQTDYRCVVEHKTISDNFTLDADSVADKIPAVYQIIGGIVGFILCVGLCVGLRIWYKKSKETQEIHTGKDSHEDRTMQVTDRITQGPPSPEESENCPLIPVQQRVADIEQISKGQSTPEKNEVNTSQGVTPFKSKTQEMRTGKDSHEDRTMQVTDRSTQDQLQDENNQGAEGGINQEGPPSPEESENCPLIPVQQRVADIEQRQSTPKKNENNIGQAVTSSRRKTQEIHRGKESHEDRKMQVTDHLIQDQSQDVHNQEAEGEINQEETQEIHTGKDSHEDRTMQVTDRSTQDQLQDENNQEAEGGINQEVSKGQPTPKKNEDNNSQAGAPFKSKTQEIRTGEVIQDDRTMQVTDHLTQDQLQDEHNQEAEGGITQEETQEIRTGKESHKDRTMEVTDHINQDQSQDENKQEAEGGINPEETQKIHTGKDSHEDRTMQVTDRITQDQLQDEHNQGAEGGINQEGPPSPEESENCPLIPVKQRVAVIEQRQSTLKKNENNIGQAVTSSRRKTQEIRTGKESHKDGTMEVTDHINQDQSQDENKQEAEGGINPEESPNHS